MFRHARGLGSVLRTARARWRREQWRGVEDDGADFAGQEAVRALQAQVLLRSRRSSTQPPSPETAHAGRDPVLHGWFEESAAEGGGYTEKGGVAAWFPRTAVIEAARADCSDGLQRRHDGDQPAVVGKQLSAAQLAPGASSASRRIQGGTSAASQPPLTSPAGHPELAGAVAQGWSSHTGQRDQVTVHNGIHNGLKYLPRRWPAFLLTPPPSHRGAQLFTSPSSMGSGETVAAVTASMKTVDSTVCFCSPTMETIQTGRQAWLTR